MADQVPDAAEQVIDLNDDQEVKTKEKPKFDDDLFFSTTSDLPSDEVIFFLLKFLLKIFMFFNLFFCFIFCLDFN